MAATKLIIIPDRRQFLVAATAHDQEIIAGLSLDRPYRGELTLAAPRSVEQNAYYWGGVLQTVVDNHPFYLSTTPLHMWLKQRLGYVKEIGFHDGQIHIHLDSTSFPVMGQDKFNEHIDKVIGLICTEVLPGLDPKELEAQATIRSGVNRRRLKVAA